jgi:c-di-GMP phosphodiesterase
MMNWTTRIDQAIGAGRLMFHCQPICSRGATPPALYEVLVRLHEADEVIPAGVFVHHASNEQLKAIDRLAIVTTLNHLKKSPTIHAVNLSAATLNDPSFPSFVSKCLDQSGANPHLLWIEVTEQVALELPSVPVLQALRGLRLQVGVDDFGVGAASIPALLSIHPDFLKVDGSLVRCILQDHWSESVIYMAMAFAYWRGIPLVLEHVESGLIESRLLAIAHDFSGLRLLFQGWLYGKAEPC